MDTPLPCHCPRGSGAQAFPPRKGPCSAQGRGALGAQDRPWSDSGPGSGSGRCPAMAISTMLCLPQAVCTARGVGSLLSAPIALLHPLHRGFEAYILLLLMASCGPSSAALHPSSMPISPLSLHPPWKPSLAQCTVSSCASPSSCSSIPLQPMMILSRPWCTRPSHGFASRSLPSASHNYQVFQQLISMPWPVWSTMQ